MIYEIICSVLLLQTKEMGDMLDCRIEVEAENGFEAMKKAVEQVKQHFLIKDSEGKYISVKVKIKGVKISLYNERI